jgi:hypothetical protein
MKRRPADRSAAAGEHARIDAGQINHANMRTEFGQKRIKQIIGVAVAVEIDRDRPGIALEQFSAAEKSDEHSLSLTSPQIAANGSGAKWPAQRQAPRQSGIHTQQTRHFSYA